MLSLNKELITLDDKKTDRRNELELEISKTDSAIDDIVCRIYGMTDAEKKIIESSLK